jgi:hypothetical protein
MYKLLIIAMVFLLGLYFIYYTNNVETFVSDKKDYKIADNCPDVLIQKGSALFLYNSKRANVPGVNPIRFENLEEYIEFTEWQRSQGILCPILYLQHAYNAQGDPVYKARPSPTNLQGGLPDYYVNQSFLNNPNIMPPPFPVPVQGFGGINLGDIPLVDMTANNANNYPSYDPQNQTIGLDTPLDKMFNDTSNKFSPNPMDDNWGGVEYTEKLVQSGYFKGNEVTK